MLKKLDIGTSEIEQVEAFNALVDAVNELQKNATHSKMEKVETPVDLYAEQRKWIGKLCRFWDVDGGGKCFSILKEIGNSNTIQVWRDGAFRAGNDYWYKHCEPVKPDDDIIYKSEKHEAPAENVQPDYVTTSYMTNGHTKEYYGQKGASVVTDYPLPEGYVITIKEPETKGDDNE